jgi:hypothetical protein
MVLYTEADFDKINEAHQRNKNLNPGKHGDEATKRTMDNLNNAGCQNSSLQELIKTASDIIKVQNNEYDKREKDQ